MATLRRATTQLFLAALCYVVAPSCSAIDIPRLEQVIDARILGSRFMGSVLVAKDGIPVLSRGYGFANVEWHIPNSPSTKFRIGSLTKQFTAASILLLEEHGKLKTSDMLKKYLPNVPSQWDRITLAELLTHTSGIPNFTDLAKFSARHAKAFTPDDIIDRLQHLPLEFAPGTAWSYSNSNYILLGRVIEKVSGHSYADFLAENIFKPLGMNDSGFDSPIDIIKNRAAGYIHNQQDLTNAPYVDARGAFAAGSLYSTTLDLLRWENALFGGRLLSPASLREMVTPVRNGYGFGVFATERYGHRSVWHNGGIEGFNGAMVFFPEEKITIIVLANVNGPEAGELADQVSKVALGERVILTSEREIVPVDNDVLNQYVGRYRFGPNSVMNITREGSHLLSQLTGQERVPFFPESAHNFFAKAVDAQITFITGPEGLASALILHQDGREFRVPRITSQSDIAQSDALSIRVRNGVPAPGSEAALRNLIAGLRAGAPPYAGMSSPLAKLVRQRLPVMRSWAVDLGSVRSIRFEEVGPAGMDVFEVTYDDGVAEWQISLNDQGKMSAASVAPFR